MKPWEYREEVHGSSVAVSERPTVEPLLEPEGDNGAYHPLLESPMPPDIRAAYDRGASVVFVRAHGRWELYKADTPPVVLAPAVLDLLADYEDNALPTRVQARLAELLSEPPEDIGERLTGAAAYVRGRAP